MARKHTYEEVEKFINIEGYKLLSKEYVNSKTKLLILCPKGHKFKMHLNSFKDQGLRCPYCSNRAKYTYDEVKEYIELFGYELLSKEYIGVGDKLLVKCPNKHKWEVRFGDFKNKGIRCSYCEGNHLYSYEYIKEYLETFDYKLLSEKYVNSKEKLKIECPNGHTYNVKFNVFQQGCRCPHCKESKGEKSIREYLENNNIEYIGQYRFEDCKFYKSLPFDFYLPCYNTIIEFDGEQHYKPIDFMGKGEEYALNLFINRIICDTIKNEYCKRNNIKLIRIPYWEIENIEYILFNKIIKNSMRD